MAFRAMGLLLIPVATLFGAVAIVVAERAEKEMVRTDAFAVVAPMQDGEVARIAVLQNPRQSVSADRPVSIGDLSVPVVQQRPAPLPADSSLFNAAEQTFLRVFRSRQSATSDGAIPAPASADIARMWSEQIAADRAGTRLDDHSPILAPIVQQPPDESNLPESEKRIPAGHYCMAGKPSADDRRGHECACKFSCSIDEHGNVSDHEEVTCLAYCHQNKRRCVCHSDEPCAGSHGHALMDMDGRVIAVARR